MIESLEALAKVKRWIGVDFDGTLAEHAGPTADWFTPGKPLAPMVARIKAMRAQGQEVRIVTARANPDMEPDVPRQVGMIQRFCLDNLGEYLKVQCGKDYAMERLYDDRAIQIACDVGEPVTWTLEKALRDLMAASVAMDQHGFIRKSPEFAAAFKALQLVEGK